MGQKGFGGGQQKRSGPAKRKSRQAPRRPGQPGTVDPSFLKAEQRALKLMQDGNFGAAKVIYRRLVEGGRTNDVIFANLAIACAMDGEAQDAIAFFRQALAINPRDADTLSNLGKALMDNGDAPGAIDAYQKALALNPQSSNILFSLGNIFGEQYELETAVDFYERALAINPRFTEALRHMGWVMLRQKNLAGAIAVYKRAIAMEGQHANGHHMLSHACFYAGDYESGWDEYEWRLKVKDHPHAHPELEKWNGHNLAEGENLVLVSEQGLGDTIQFMRYVAYLNSTGVPASLCAEPKLHGLIRSSEITGTIYSPAEADQLRTGKWLELLSLPRYLRVRPDHPLINTPYIKATEQANEKWKQKLASEKRPIIGINWQGDPRFEVGVLKGRSLPLERFSIITRTPGFSLLSLQKGYGAEQLADCSFAHRFVRCQEEINETWDFVETAAIITNCDLVITSDTAVAHLSGGLGKPTWLLLRKDAEWRWGLEGATTFWYPSMRLFRQRERSNWGEVMERVVAMLDRAGPHGSADGVTPDSA